MTGISGKLVTGANDFDVNVVLGLQSYVFVIFASAVESGLFRATIAK
jgi:hypothetical protein